MPRHDPWDHNPEGPNPKDTNPKTARPSIPPQKITSPEGLKPKGHQLEDTSLPREHEPSPEGLTMKTGGTHAGPTHAVPNPEAASFLHDAETHPGAGGSFLPHDHDHGHCIADALLKAEEICAERGARLTRIRRSVLEFVWESHSPVGAYDILGRMNADSRLTPGPLPGGKYMPAAGARSAPITVYRALEFLMAQGLVHRLASLNAYTGCGIPGTPHGAHFLICEDCGAAAELHDPGIDRAISEGAARAGFAVKAPVVEVQGRCPACAAKEGPSRTGVLNER